MGTLPKDVSAGEDEMRSMNQSSIPAGSILTAGGISLLLSMSMVRMGEGRRVALVARDGSSESPAARPLSTPVKECQRSPPVRSGE